MSVTTPETFKFTGGAVDSEGATTNARIITSLANEGFTGTLTAASGGTPASIAVTLPSSTWNTAQLGTLVRIAKVCNARLVYTKAS